MRIQIVQIEWGMGDTFVVHLESITLSSFLTNTGFVRHPAISRCLRASCLSPRGSDWSKGDPSLLSSDPIWPIGKGGSLVEGLWESSSLLASHRVRQYPFSWLSHVWVWWLELWQSACLQHGMAELRGGMTGFLTTSTSHVDLPISGLAVMWKKALFPQRMSESWHCIRGKTIPL